MADPTTPHRVQRKRTKGWRMPENTVYVGSPTDFANPFIGRTNADAVRVYREWLANGGITVAVGPSEAIVAMRHVPGWDIPEEIIRRSAGLRGKNLACWCPLDQPCHADVLLELANG